MSSSEDKWFEMYPYLTKIRLWEFVYREAMAAVGGIYDADTEFRDVRPTDPFPQKQWPIRLDTPCLTEFSILVYGEESMGVKFELSGCGVGSSSVNLPNAIDGSRVCWVRSHGTPATTDEELATCAKKIVAEAMRLLLPLR